MRSILGTPIGDRATRPLRGRRARWPLPAAAMERCAPARKNLPVPGALLFARRIRRWQSYTGSFRDIADVEGAAVSLNRSAFP